MEEHDDSIMTSSTAVIPPPPLGPPPDNTLPNRVSEDDEDSTSVTSTSRDDPHSQLVHQVQSTQDGDAMAYLLRYETMVRQQEADDMAVLAHIRPCINRLLTFIGQPRVPNDLSFLSNEISFVQLQAALNILEQQSSQTTEFIMTDRQLVMALRMLTQKANLLKPDQENDAKLSWAEFVQCYKVCISGMVTLQHLPPDTAVRARAMDRTLAMLSLFEPPSTQLFHQDILLSHNFNNNNKAARSPPDVPFTLPVPQSTKPRAGFLSVYNNKRTRRTLALLALFVVGWMALLLALLYGGVVTTTTRSHSYLFSTPTTRTAKNSMPPSAHQADRAFPPVKSMVVVASKQQPSTDPLGVWTYDNNSTLPLPMNDGIPAPVVAAIVAVYFVAGPPVAMATLASAGVAVGVQRLWQLVESRGD